jgi:predicted DNA-binding protein (MmcQ/YjbR family)
LLSFVVFWFVVSVVALKGDGFSPAVTPAHGCGFAVENFVPLRVPSWLNHTPMNLESLREYCLSFPHTTENIQWGSDLLFKIGGKMFAVAATEPGRIAFCFKATPDHFFEYQERERVIPAPYMARNQWLALETWDALRDDEVRDLIAISYRLVLEKLPKRLQAQLQTTTLAKPAKKKPRPPAKKSAKKKSAKKKPAKKTTLKSKSKRRK